MNENIQGMLQVFLEEQKQKLDDLDNEIANIAEELLDINWFLAPGLSCSDTKKWLNEGLEGERLRKKIDCYYANHDYKNLYREFENIESILKKDEYTQGYLKQVRIIKDNFIQNHDTFLIAINCIVSIIEFEYVNAIDELNTSNIMKYVNVEHLKNELKDRDDQEVIAISSNMALLKFLNFSEFEEGINHTLFTRHSLQHGRYNPDRLDISDFIYCVCLLSSVCSLAETLKNEEFNSLKEELRTMH